MDIKKVTPEEAEYIIETRLPIGLFYTTEIYKGKNLYVGIDNSNGHAWTEDFKTLSSCKKWLQGY